MILQVLPDAGQCVAQGDVVCFQGFRRPDARQEQQLRGIEGASAEDDFAFRLDPVQVLCLLVFNTHGPLACKQDPRDMGMADDGQIWPGFDRVQIGGCGRTAFAIALAASKLRDLIQARAFLVRAVRETGIAVRPLRRRG